MHFEMTSRRARNRHRRFLFRGTEITNQFSFPRTRTHEKGETLGTAHYIPPACGLRPYRRVAYRKVREGDTQVVAILRVERGVVDQIDTAADHVTGSEGRPVRLTCAGRAKAVAVIAVITIRVLVPSWQPIHVDTVCREPNAHVPITSLAHNLYFEVVQAAGCWYGVCCANTGSVFVSFTVTWEKRRRKRRLSIVASSLWSQ